MQHKTLTEHQGNDQRRSEKIAELKQRCETQMLLQMWEILAKKECGEIDYGRARAILQKNFQRWTDGDAQEVIYHVLQFNLDGFLRQIKSRPSSLDARTYGRLEVAFSKDMIDALRGQLSEEVREVMEE